MRTDLQRLMAGAIWACGVVAISACSDGPAKEEQAVPVSRDAAPGNPTSSTSPASVVAPCASHQVRLSRPRTDGAAGTMTAIVAVSNTGEASCELPNDHPDIDFLDASGAPVALQVEKEPGQPTGEVVLSPGGQEAFVIRYDNSGPDCSRIETLRVDAGTGRRWT